MNNLRDKIVKEIIAERERQISKCKHGGDTDEFDKQNTKNDWIAYINAYSGRASDKVSRNQREGQTFRENLIKVGALVLAALESHDKEYC